MSATREPENLKPLDEAKKWFKAVLKLRIDTYENRLRQPFWKQAFEYTKTGFGKKGYDRTAAFLAAIDEERIEKTEDLVDLTLAYTTEGKELPFLLKRTVAEVCGFHQTHIDLVIAQLEQEQLFLNKDTAEYQALDIIYDNIIDSEAEDYGEAYLAKLNKQLIKYSHIARP